MTRKEKHMNLKTNSFSEVRCWAWNKSWSRSWTGSYAESSCWPRPSWSVHWAMTENKSKNWVQNI